MVHVDTFDDVVGIEDGGITPQCDISIETSEKSLS
jgi:hypothetical protein